MQRYFDEELMELNTDILKIGALTQEAIFKSIEALKNHDKAQAQEVIFSVLKVMFPVINKIFKLSFPLLIMLN